MKQSSPSLWQWAPTDIRASVRGLVMGWQYVGAHRFVEPFFADSLVATAGMGPEKRELEVAAISEVDDLDCLEPRAFIFHASRCGSTLMGQLLGESEKHIVVSEAPVIDAALGYASSEEWIFKRVIRALGQRRGGRERHLFVKLDSWHLFHLPVIQKTYPDVPMLFLYREPGAIMESHKIQRGGQMVPGVVDYAAMGVELEVVYHDLDAYCREVLEALYGRAIEFASEGRLKLLQYDQLPELVWRDLIDFLSLDLSAGEVLAMGERAMRHSKRPQEFFGGEGRKAVREGKLYEQFLQLEELRREHGIGEWA
ncbi:hypothetical protein [Rubritalea tangerina]|uniref:Sulfotransferase family protein n=1 Tax=Rubritalea tangerina TaxID=430798 RepID=A0ABW4ZGM5_9BACT